jgi:hypothetical protein
MENLDQLATDIESTLEDWDPREYEGTTYLGPVFEEVECTAASVVKLWGTNAYRDFVEEFGGS